MIRMMSKTVLLAMLSSCLTVNAYAQLFDFGASKTNNAKSQAAPLVTPSPVLSPEDFQKAAGNLSTQTKNNVEQQSIANIPKVTTPTAAPTPAQISPSTQENNINTQTTPDVSTPNIATPTPNSSPPLTARPVDNNTAGSAPTNATPFAPTKSQSPQGQVYTGFSGGSTSNTQGGNAPNNSSNGLGIKY